MRYAYPWIFFMLSGLSLACASPLREGTYAFEISRLEQNTCAFWDEEDFGVGEVVLLSLTWKDEDTFVLTDGDDPQTYELLDGDDIERVDVITGRIEEDCSYRQDMVFSGVLTSSTSFQTEGRYDLTTEGDCDGVQDADALPCSAELSTKAEREE